MVVADGHRQLAQLGVQRGGEVGRQRAEGERLLGTGAGRLHVADVLPHDRRPHQQRARPCAGRLRWRRPRRAAPEASAGSVGDVDRVADQAPRADRPLALQRAGRAARSRSTPGIQLRWTISTPAASWACRAGSAGTSQPGEQLGGRVADREDPRLVAGDRPEAAEQRHQPRDDLAVADGQRVPQHVGEVVLLADQDVEELDLVVGDDEVRRTGRRARAPTGAGRRRASSCSPAAASRVAAYSRIVSSARKRALPRSSPITISDCSTSTSTRSGPSGPSTLARGRAVEAVLEDRQPRERPLLVGRQQVPRPRDHGLEGAVPVGRAAVAAAERGEPVVERCGHLGHGHRAHPGRGELDGQRQPVEPLDHRPHRRRVEDRVGPGRRGPSHEQLRGVGRRTAG